MNLSPGRVIAIVTLSMSFIVLAPAEANAGPGGCDSNEVCFWNFGTSSTTSSFDQRTVMSGGSFVLTGDPDLRNDSYDIVRGGVKWMHNTVSTLRINHADLYIKVYKGLNYSGDNLWFSGVHTINLGNFGFSNNVSSFKVLKTSDPAKISAFCG